MTKLHEKLAVKVTITKPTNTLNKRNSRNNGFFQNLGVCNATVAVRAPVLSEKDKKDGVIPEKDIIIIDRLHGFCGMSQRDGNKSKVFVVNYDNTPRSDDGERVYPPYLITDELANLLKVETAKSLSDGYAAVSRNEETAIDGGVGVDEYTSMIENCLTKAEVLHKEAEAAKPAETKATNEGGAEQLSKDTAVEEASAE